MFLLFKFTGWIMKYIAVMKLYILSSLFLITSCTHSKNVQADKKQNSNNQSVFWQELKKICGKAFAGTVIAAPPNDTVFKNKLLLMHVRACEENRIRIPFMVGDDRSRTWVFTRSRDWLLLKHDHRHQDGTADSITMYGGRTSNAGSTIVQFFPADQETVNMLAHAAGNVWWVELEPGKYFTYNLRRMGTDRLFSIRFDLTIPVTSPPAPWGWKE